VEAAGIVVHWLPPPGLTRRSHLVP